MRPSKGISIATFAVLSLFIITGMTFGLWWQISVQTLFSPGQYAEFTASQYIGAIIGSLLAAGMLLHCGSHWTLHFSCLPNLAGWFYLFFAVQSITSHDVSMSILFYGRLLTGVAVGLMVPAGLIYLLELAPTGWSGLFGCLPPLGFALGSTVAHAILVYSDYVYFVFAGSVLLVAVNLAIWLLPESPRWLTQTEQFEKAAAACSWFENQQDYQELVDSEALLKKAPECRDNAGIPLTRFRRFKQSLCCCVNMSPVEKSNVCLPVSLLAMQQLTAIGPLLNFCETIFTYSGSSWTEHYAGMIGLPECIFALVAAIVAIYAPRKKMLLFSTLILSLSHFLLGLLLKFDQFKPISPFTVFSIALGVGGYSLGWGPIPLVMVAEMFNTQCRGCVVATAMVISWSLGLAAVLTFEAVSALLGVPLYFWVSSFTCAVCGFCVLLCVPETKPPVYQNPMTNFVESLKLESIRTGTGRRATGLRMKGV